MDKNYYLQKKQKLQLKGQQILQDYINAGFKMVRDAQDNDAEVKEIDGILAELEVKEKQVNQGEAAKVEDKIGATEEKK